MRIVIAYRAARKKYPEHFRRPATDDFGGRVVTSQVTVGQVIGVSKYRLTIVTLKLSRDGYLEYY